MFILSQNGARDPPAKWPVTAPSGDRGAAGTLVAAGLLRVARRRDQTLQLGPDPLRPGRGGRGHRVGTGGTITPVLAEVVSGGSAPIADRRAMILGRSVVPSHVANFGAFATA